MAITEEAIQQAENALDTLKEAVFHLVYDHNAANPCFTKNFSEKLGLHAPEDVEIIRSILVKLKADGFIENLGNNDDAWVIKKPQS